MEAKEIFSHVDHTLLKPTATFAQMEQTCLAAQQYGAASACIPPAFVAEMRRRFPQLKLCTVIGFPLGYATAESKCYEAADAFAKGADEIDMVIFQGWVQEGRFAETAKEILAVRKAVPDAVLKVIVETCYLDENAKGELCRIFPDTGADYMKTSTGFGPAGAQLEDIRLFRSLLPESIKLKAAGGIRSKEEMEAFLQAGADRLGCSAALSLFVR